MDGLAHMQAFIHLINEIMAPILKLGDASFEERPAPHIISRQLGPNDQPVAVSIEGWGIAFEKVSMRWKTGMDLTLDPETAAVRLPASSMTRSSASAGLPPGQQPWASPPLSRETTSSPRPISSWIPTQSPR